MGPEDFAGAAKLDSKLELDILHAKNIASEHPQLEECEPQHCG